MSVSSDQLGEIYRSLRQTFHDHPAIAIRPLKGDPPEQYEILYTISGYCKTGRGEVRLENEHRIEFTIPFGFPHFPPSCKPKTDIFHPDFDPAAICLSDFWQPGQEVAGLIIHLGRLINGEMYSSDNAFNEEAAKWYSEHSELFPLSIIPWGSEIVGIDEATDPPVPQIDTIEEEDLVSSFDLLSLERDSVEAPIAQTSAAEKASSTEEDLAYLQLLRKRKKFFKLRQLLTNTPPSSTETKQLLALCETEIGKAEVLHQSAREAEEADDSKNAARLFLEIVAIVSDFPNLDDDRKRTEAALAMASEKKKFPQDLDHEDFLPVDHEIPEHPPLPKVTTAEKPTKNKIAGRNIAVKSNLFQTKNVLFLVSILVVLGVGGYFGTSFYAANQLQQAEKALVSCKAALEKNSFEVAQQACNLALQKAIPSFGLRKVESDALNRQIDEILNSEQLRQGLAGNVLVNGKYLPKKEAMALEDFNRFHQEAESLFTQKQWPDAEDRLRKLLALAERGAINDPNAIKGIKSKLEYLRFMKMFEAANALIADRKWQEATVTLQKGKALLDSLPDEERRRHELELNAALVKCNFEEFRQLGDDFFSKSDWNKAIATYKAALPSAENNKLASQETLKELRENIAKAELYAAIDAGNKAFAAAEWEAAILDYNKASTILSSQVDSMKTVDAQFTRKKLERIILQTTVIKDRQTAQSAERDKQDPIQARNIYRQLVATLNKSAFVGEEEFAEVKKTSLAAIEALDKRIYLAEKEKHLKDNFRSLFQQNYPNVVAENLTNSQVAFTKEMGDKLIFKMQCQETGQGRPLTLVMFYAYDKSENRWAFHSEQ